MLLGYTGIVSFAHTMFFAIGAYGGGDPAGQGLGRLGRGRCSAPLAGGWCVMVVAAGIGLLSLRVRAIFFSMITLAVASFAQLLATQWRGRHRRRGRADFRGAHALKPSFRLVEAPVLGVRLDGRVVAYYLVFAVSLVLFLAMLRVVNSPFGRVLQAIRENAFRTEALG